MTGPAAGLFVALIALLTIGVVALARASARLLTSDEPLAGSQRDTLGASHASLLVNLSLTHFAIALVVAAIAWLTQVPFEVLGVGKSPDVLAGILLGVGIYAIDEGLGIVVRARGHEEPTMVRELLAPESRSEWVLLLVVVLPIIAFGEEFLFRGALIGGVASVTGLSPWLLAVLSSICFGLAHTAQGSVGIAATAALGLALAAGFVLTGNLWLVVIAHYLVNALEFAVHEALDLDFA
jgi:membrane protease YdiL (CAAX protease family)